MAGADHRIDYERVRAARAQRERYYAADPANALTVKTVTARLLDTYHKFAEVRGVRIESDEPEATGGKGLAPQPTEFMLMSLAFCQMSIIVGCAVASRVRLDDIEITVTGRRDSRGLAGIADVRPGYFEIEMHVKLFSDEPIERLRQLAALSERRCPVYDNLTNPTLVINRVTRGDDVVFGDRPAEVERQESDQR